MNNHLSVCAQDLMFSIALNDGEIPILAWYFQLPDLLMEINEVCPNFLSYQIKREYGLLRIFNEDEEELLRSSEIKELEAKLDDLSKEPRYKQLLELRKKNPEFKFIYGDFPCESDDVISFMKGMSAEEIYERRKQVEIICSQTLSRFDDDYQRKSCAIFSLR